MSKFSRNILLLFIGWVIFIQLTFFFTDAPYWGNEIYQDKLEYLSKHSEEFNTVFLGSSKILSQVDPIYFDSLTTSKGMSSINLGAPYVNNPEVYYLYENLLKREDLQLKYAFLELNTLLSIEWSKLRTKRNYYWCNGKYLKYSFDYLQAANYSIQKKVGLGFLYWMNFLNKNLTLAHLNPTSDEDPQIGMERKGFGPMNGTMENLAGLDYQRSLSEHYFGEQNLEQNLNSFHLEKLQHLIQLSEAKGIHLVFIISPRIAFQYSEILAIAKKLPTKHLIEIGDATKYPTMYAPEYSSDDVHINEAGAKIFTEYLAKKFEAQCF